MSNDIQPASSLSNIPEERFENPGLPPHQPRKNESKPGLQKVDSLVVTGIFSLSALASLAAVVLFFVLPDYTTLANIKLGNLVLGLGLAIGFGGIGFAAVYWAKALMNDEEMVEERDIVRTSPTRRQKLWRSCARASPTPASHAAPSSRQLSAERSRSCRSFSSPPRQPGRRGRLEHRQAQAHDVGAREASHD